MVILIYFFHIREASEQFFKICRICLLCPDKAFPCKTQLLPTLKSYNLISGHDYFIQIYYEFLQCMIKSFVQRFFYVFYSLLAHVGVIFGYYCHPPLPLLDINYIVNIHFTDVFSGDYRNVITHYSLLTLFLNCDSPGG